VIEIRSPEDESYEKLPFEPLAANGGRVHALYAVVASAND
jgi:hypothetical protein